MLDKWFTKKNKYKKENPDATYEMYSINEFIFDEKIKKKVNRLLKNYRDEFKPKLLKENSTTDMGMLLATLPITDELKSYYNNDLCVSVATSVAVARGTDFNLRTHAYYVENALLRISNAWEYLFIILNQFLYTDLVVGNDLRNKIIEAKCHNIDFVKHNKGYKPVITRLPDKIVDKIKPEIKKEHKLFNISTKSKSNSFHKTLKKKYCSNDNLQIILDLYYCKDVKEIIELRNEIVHRRSLGAKFSVAPIDFMPAQGININPKGWYDFKNLDIKIEKNLVAIRTATQMVIDIIFTNDVPNQKANEDKTFFVYKVECCNCSKKLLINDVTVDYFKKHGELLICPYCKGNNTTVKEKIEVHDRYYFSNIREYNEFIFDYWKIHDEKREHIRE
ncbi:hypothetical protein [Tepidibacter mesophilus]|uniref:hypothetical protein n=1 Tax=Tepidibacter mesophilus TaxID=655607 RepID=UPI000C089C82|nr:hypothetical protein [Tepidibacter mesophilus]